MEPPLIGASLDLLFSNKRKTVKLIISSWDNVLFRYHHFTLRLPKQAETLPKTANLTAGI